MPFLIQEKEKRKSESEAPVVSTEKAVLNGNRVFAFFTAVLFFLLIGSGFYLLFSVSWSDFYKWVVIAHPFIGFLTVIHLSVWFVLKGIRSAVRPGGAGFARKRLAFRQFFNAGRSRIFLTLLFTYAIITGIALLAPSSSTARYSAHRYASFAWTLVLAAAVLFQFRRDKRKIFIFFSACAAFLILFSVLVRSENSSVQTFSVNLTELLKKPPATTGSHSALLNITSACGEKGCHPDIVKEYIRSTHFVSPRMHYIQKINAVLKKENPSGERWCSGCHFPQGTFSGSFSFKDQQGISCVFCHSVRSVRVESLQKGVKKGYDVALSRHLSMFPEDSVSGQMTSFNRFLIRLNRPGHVRVFKKPLYKDFSFCMPCHESNFPPPERESVIRPNCVDCHMRLQKPFSRGNHQFSHLFLGGNTLIPHILKDRTMGVITERWLTGNFGSKVWDSYWELRQGAGDPPSRVTWLLLTMEPLSTPVPGQMCRVRMYTSNPGGGHPFPVGAFQLFDIWLDFKVETKEGKLIYKNGKPVAEMKNYFSDGTHRLGGVMLNKDGKPVEGPFFWKKKSMKKRWVEWGRTITDDFAFKVPAEAKDYVVVYAAWRYSRLNKEFARYVFGKDIDLPAVTLASVTQRVLIEMK